MPQVTQDIKPRKCKKGRAVSVTNTISYLANVSPPQPAR